MHLCIDAIGLPSRAPRTVHPPTLLRPRPLPLLRVAPGLASCCAGERGKRFRRRVVGHHNFGIGRRIIRVCAVFIPSIAAGAVNPCAFVIPRLREMPRVIAPVRARGRGALFPLVVWGCRLAMWYVPTGLIGEALWSSWGGRGLGGNGRLRIGIGGVFGAYVFLTCGSCGNCLCGSHRGSHLGSRGS